MKIVNIKNLLVVASTLLILFSTFSLAAKHKSKNLEQVENNNNYQESILSAAMGPDDKKEVPKPVVKPTTAAPAKKANPTKQAKPSKKSPMSGKKAPAKKGNSDKALSKNKLFSFVF